MVHQYQLGGYNIVLDICSGAVHVVDEVAYDIDNIGRIKNPVYRLLVNPTHLFTLQFMLCREGLRCTYRFYEAPREY